jgi:hypothetical protein
MDDDGLAFKDQTNVFLILKPIHWWVSAGIKLDMPALYHVYTRSSPMSLVIDVLLGTSVICCIAMFIIFYCIDRFRCNPKFNGQMRSISGIITFNQPLFGMLMHFVSGMMLLSAGLKVVSDPETSFTTLALLYASFSGVVSFNVNNHKPFHFLCVLGVATFGMAFVWIQCDRMFAIVCLSMTSIFMFVILLNVTLTKWAWPWMDVQASLEIVWVASLLAAILWFCIPLAPPQEADPISHVLNQTRI